MKKLLFILLAFCSLAIQAQPAKQKLTRPGINSTTAIVATSEEINVLDSVKTDQPIQRQLDKTLKVADGVPAVNDFYNKAEVNLIRDNLKQQERQHQLLRLGADTLFFPVVSSGSFGSSGTVLIDNTAYVMAYEIEVPTRIQSVKWVPSATGNATWDGFNGFVLLNSSGTKIDETANTNWTQTAYQLASLDFTTKAILQPGIYYLWQGSNWSAQVTQPAVYTLAGTNAITNRFISSSHRFIGTITGQTNVPTSITISSLTEVSTVPGFVLCQ